LARRERFCVTYLQPFVSAEGVRDYALYETEIAICPYTSMLTLVEISDLGAAGRWLHMWITLLGSRPMFSGGTYWEAGKPWWSFHQLTTGRYRDQLHLAWAEIATHNHFAPLKTPAFFKQTAPITKLPIGTT